MSCARGTCGGQGLWCPSDYQLQCLCLGSVSLVVKTPGNTIGKITCSSHPGAHPVFRWVRACRRGQSASDLCTLTVASGSVLCSVAHVALALSVPRKDWLEGHARPPRDAVCCPSGFCRKCQRPPERSSRRPCNVNLAGCATLIRISVTSSSIMTTTWAFASYPPPQAFSRYFETSLQFTLVCEISVTGEGVNGIPEPLP